MPSRLTRFGINKAPQYKELWKYAKNAVADIQFNVMNFSREIYKNLNQLEVQYFLPNAAEKGMEKILKLSAKNVKIDVRKQTDEIESALSKTAVSAIGEGAIAAFIEGVKARVMSQALVLELEERADRITETFIRKDKLQNMFNTLVQNKFEDSGYDPVWPPIKRGTTRMSPVSKSQSDRGTGINRGRSALMKKHGMLNALEMGELETEYSDRLKTVRNRMKLRTKIPSSENIIYDAKKYAGGTHLVRRKESTSRYTNAKMQTIYRKPLFDWGILKKFSQNAWTYNPKKSYLFSASKDNQKNKTGFSGKAMGGGEDNINYNIKLNPSLRFEFADQALTSRWLRKGDYSSMPKTFGDIIRMHTLGYAVPGRGGADVPARPIPPTGKEMYDRIWLPLMADVRKELTGSLKGMTPLYAEKAKDAAAEMLRARGSFTEYFVTHIVGSFGKEPAKVRAIAAKIFGEYDSEGNQIRKGIPMWESSGLKSQVKTFVENLKGAQKDLYASMAESLYSAVDPSIDSGSRSRTINIVVGDKADVGSVDMAGKKTKGTGR